MGRILLKKKLICIVTPVFNEEENLGNYFVTTKKFFEENSNYDFNVILVDDGSVDKSWNKIFEICKTDQRYRGIRLSRNHGSHLALAAGLDCAEGDAVSILACDLQDPIETVKEFISRWENGAEVVWGKRKEREDASWRVLASKTLFWLLRRFAFQKSSKFTTGSFLLVDKKVLKCLKLFKETNRVTFALVAWTGFNQDVVEYKRNARTAGSSGWSVSKMLKTMYDAFIGFSNLPTRILTWSGVLFVFASLAFSTYLIFDKITGNPMKGWTGIMLAISIFFAFQCFIFAVVGEYLSRIYSEVVRRPIYFVSEDYKLEGEKSF